jgi:hypothetical protein
MQRKDTGDAAGGTGKSGSANVSPVLSPRAITSLLGMDEDLMFPTLPNEEPRKAETGRAVLPGSVF